MNKETILVVEDEPDIHELILLHLAQSGYNTISAYSGEDGLAIAQKELPDLILLDLMLPGMDGLDVCKKIKEHNSTKDINIIILTAKGEEIDIVIGLELGADDYIVKPYRPNILTSRIKAILRRKKAGADESKETIIKIHDIEINTGKHKVMADGKICEMTYTEFAILHLLARRPGWVFTRNQILDSSRGEDALATDRAVDVQIAGLRKKLGKSGKWIETVRGIGYKIREVQ